MENATKQIEVSKELSRPLERINNKRQTRPSLSKLIINPPKGPAPIRIPTPKVARFIQDMADNAPDSIAFLPLPISLGSPSCGIHTNAHREHVDPYLASLPTPITIQFTMAESIELQQWQEIVGGMRAAHAEALDQLWDNPKDTELRAKVRQLRTARQEHADSIARIHERRGIRKAFRQDFNDMVPGW